MKARKERHILRKNWSSLRAKIAKVIIEKNILNTDFHSLPIHDTWKQIQDKILTTFCNLAYIQGTSWLWDDFKLDTFSTKNIDRPESYLDKLVDEKETVWYIVTETINEKTKLWLYEGKIKTIQAIIDESWFDEMYIVSKKYEWLICINHHDNLIATGAIMPDKLRQLNIKKQTAGNIALLPAADTLRQQNIHTVPPSAML